MDSKPEWCDWWTPREWQWFLRLVKMFDEDGLYAKGSGDVDLRVLAAAVRDTPSGKWTVTVKERVSQYQQAAPSDVEDQTANLPASVDTTLGDWPSVRDRLRPVLRAATYGLEATLDGIPPLARPALPFLQERVVVDMPTLMRHVTASEPDSWGVTPEEVFATARANLAAMAPRPDGAAEGAAILNFVDEDGDLYLSSLPLLDGWLASLAPAVGGRPVAFMPEHASLVVASDTDDLVQEMLKSVEEQYKEADRRLSPLAYTVDESGALIPYPAPDGHPAAPAMRRATMILTTTEYEMQRRFLEPHYEQELVPTFVASLMTKQDLTVAVWGEDVDTMLPQADRVAFVGEDVAPFVVPWESVAELVSLTPEADVEPPRYRVHSWPAPDVMARLRTRATPL